MILVGGTQLTINELPMSELMDYQIESGGPLGIKLKTVAKAPTCFKIYLNESLRDEYSSILSPDVESKVQYFNNDEDLVKYLLYDNNDEEDEEIESFEVPEFEEPVKAPEVIKVNINKEELSYGDLGTDEKTEWKEENEELDLEASKESSSNNILELEDVDTDLPSVFLEIPTLGEDIDSLRLQLETKDRLIAQKESMIKELEMSIEDAYKLQEQQMLELKDLYTKQMEQVNKEIEELSEKANGIQVDKEAAEFVKYQTYSKRYKGAQRETFTSEEQKAFNNLKSDIYIFATSGGDSYYSMQKQIRVLVNKEVKALLVDFSNDVYLKTVCSLNSKRHSMELVDSNVETKDLVESRGDLKIIQTTIFNDIGLLSVDWLDVLKKLDKEAGGRPIILLFNNINSFSVRYTVSKLATIGKLSLFVKSTPLVLTTFYSEAKFIPEDRFNVVALEYIDAIKDFLSKISEKYSVKAFAKDVEWGKIGIKHF